MLRKYLVRCKFVHSLAFFRWRNHYADAISEEAKEDRMHVLKEIFESKVDFMKKHFEKATQYRKQITP